VEMLLVVVVDVEEGEEVLVVEEVAVFVLIVGNRLVHILGLKIFSRFIVGGFCGCLIEYWGNFLSEIGLDPVPVFNYSLITRSVVSDSLFLFSLATSRVEKIFFYFFRIGLLLEKSRSCFM